VEILTLRLGRVRSSCRASIARSRQPVLVQPRSRTSARTHRATSSRISVTRSMGFPFRSSSGHPPRVPKGCQAPLPWGPLAPSPPRPLEPIREFDLRWTMVPPSEQVEPPRANGRVVNDVDGVMCQAFVHRDAEMARNPLLNERRRARKSERPRIPIVGGERPNRRHMHLPAFSTHDEYLASERDVVAAIHAHPQPSRRISLSSRAGLRS
jgi:hypothetical protein